MPFEQIVPDDEFVPEETVLLMSAGEQSCCAKCEYLHHERHPGNAKARLARDLERGDIKALRREQDKQERRWGRIPEGASER